MTYFYGFKPQEIYDLTLYQFFAYQKQMVAIKKLENPLPEEPIVPPMEKLNRPMTQQEIDWRLDQIKEAVKNKKK